MTLGAGRATQMRTTRTRWPAQKINKAVGVVVLVRSQRFDPHSFSSLAPDHLLGRLPFRRAPGLTDFEIDQKPVSVLHQRMCPVTQLGLFARPLAGQRTLGWVFDSWVSLLRFSAWKSTQRLPGSP